jgi:hypothetical protein
MCKKTNIPNEEYLEILERSLNSGELVVSLNERENYYYPKPIHKNSKRIYPFWKICELCEQPFQTFTGEQAVRNKYCSKNCAKRKKGTGLKKKEDRKITFLICDHCGKEFFKFNCHISRTNKNYCSYSCNGKVRGDELKKHGHKGRKNWSKQSEENLKKRMTGESNPSWKGGVTYKRPKGNYKGVKYIRCPEQFIKMARKDGYVMEHRIVMAKQLNRLLDRIEVVHHIDHDPSNNNINNLMLFKNNSDHKSYEWGQNITPIWQPIINS